MAGLLFTFYSWPISTKLLRCLCFILACFSPGYLLLPAKHVGCQQSDFKTKKMLMLLSVSLLESERENHLSG